MGNLTSLSGAEIMETITPLLEKKKQEECDQKVAEDVLLEAFLEQLKERHKNVCLFLFIIFMQV